MQVYEDERNYKYCKIELKDLPESYEKGNLIFFKEPYKVSMIAWGKTHPGCKAIILDDDEYAKDLIVFVVAYPKSKKYNIELFDLLKDHKEYAILNQYYDSCLHAVEV